jgi:hypothetical protein
MALGSTQHLTDMSTRNLPGGKDWPAREAESLIAICEPIVSKMWEPRRLTTLWAFMACYRDSFTFTCYKHSLLHQPGLLLLLLNLPTHTHTDLSLWTYSTISPNFQAHLFHSTLPSTSKHQHYNYQLHSTNTEELLNSFKEHEHECKSD